MNDQSISEIISRNINFASTQKSSSGSFKTPRAYQRNGRCGFLFALAFFALAASASAQPTMSRGEQLLPISYNECIRRAEQAYVAEGWVNLGKGGAFVNAFKENNGAYIMCNVAPENKIWVNIVVASNSGNSSVPGAQRVCLQAQMDQPGASRCGGNTNASGGTRWLYRDGSFTDFQILFPNGTAKSESNREASARWSTEGGELVVRWWNGWVNRYPWNPSANELTGVAIGPSGDRHSITLTRQP
jgi:hypothetical protein